MLSSLQDLPSGETTKIETNFLGYYQSLTDLKKGNTQFQATLVILLHLRKEEKSQETLMLFIAHRFRLTEKLRLKHRTIKYFLSPHTSFTITFIKVHLLKFLLHNTLSPTYQEKITRIPRSQKQNKTNKQKNQTGFQQREYPSQPETATKIMASSPITSCKDGETVETVVDFILGGSKITADGDYSHEIKRHLLLGRKVMTNVHSILKSRDITLPTNVCQVKPMVFLVVMYGL